MPDGSTILGLTYGNISGDVGFDPVLDIEDTKVNRYFLIMSYARFFTVAEKSMRIDILLPFHKAKWDGLLSGKAATAERTGFGNPKFRLSINLLDTDSKVSNDSEETSNTVVGAAIAIGVPLGEYYEDKLLNLGSNRYTVRPQIGVVYTRGPWSYELTGSVFFFTDNDSFVNGAELEQKPFYSAQTHFVRTFESGTWASLSVGYGQGGALKINGVNKDDKREGFIGAISGGFPLADQQSLKFSYIWAKTRTDTETRSQTDTFAVSWLIHF